MSGRLAAARHTYQDQTNKIGERVIKMPHLARSRHLHRAIAVAGVVGSCIAVAAFVSSTAASAKTGKKIVIGSVVNDLTNPFLSTMAKAEQAEAAKEGVTIHVVSGSSTGTISISTEISEMQQFISEKVSAILVTPSDSQAIVPVVKQANAAGIPVIAVNTPVASGAKVVTFVGDNDYQYGVLEGKLVAKALNGQGNVAILEGVLGDSPEVLRTEAINATLAKYPGIHVVTSEVDDWVNATNVTDVQNLMAKYPGTQLNAVVAEGPEMFDGAEYARQQGNTTWQFVAGDYSTEVESAIKSGALYGTVDQNPKSEGQLGVEAAVDWLTGKRSAVKRPNDYIPLPLITKANVNKIPATWAS
jgi:ABC-type sugar transport system substrate-binding protein